MFICRGFGGLFLELFFGGGSHDKSDEAADEVLLGVVLSELKKREKKMRPHLKKMQKDIEANQDNALSLCTEKVLLAQQAYELVSCFSNFNFLIPMLYSLLEFIILSLTGMLNKEF